MVGEDGVDLLESLLHVVQGHVARDGSPFIIEEAQPSKSWNSGSPLFSETAYHKERTCTLGPSRPP